MGVILKPESLTERQNYTVDCAEEIKDEYSFKAQNFHEIYGLFIDSIVEVISYYAGFNNVIAVYPTDSINYMLHLHLENSIGFSALNITPIRDADINEIQYDIGLFHNDNISHITMNIDIKKRYDSQNFRRSKIQLGWLRDNIHNKLLIYNTATRLWTSYIYN